MKLQGENITVSERITLPCDLHACPEVEVWTDLEGEEFDLESGESDLEGGESDLEEEGMNGFKCQLHVH